MRWGWKARGGETTPYSTWTKMVRLVKKSKSQNVVMSSEFFSELSMDHIKKIQSSIGDREVKVLFTLRPLAKLLSSSYQQYLKFGVKDDYSTWLHSVLDEPGVSKITPTFWKRHMHGKVVSAWAEVFGAANISVIVVDEQNPEFLFQSINKYLNLAPGFLKPQPTSTNRSLSLEETTLLLELNRKFPEKRDWDEYEVFVRKGYIRYLTNTVSIKDGKDKLPTPAWAVAKANEVASASKLEITELGVEVIGDIESLDSAKVLEGEPSYPSTIDIETVVQAMLAFDKRSINWFPLSWLFSSLKKKVRQWLMPWKKRWTSLS